MMNLIFAALFAGIALYMVCRAHFERTRRVAYVLMAASAVELTVAGLLSLTAYPALTAILMIARLSLMGCGVAASRADQAAARRRAERRRAFARKLRCAEHPLSVVPSARPVQAAPAVRCA
ncbi:MAG: hypothetical protein IKI63_02780 [Clostridia bacterium]|nr:hypothetical protein [Clostridia bacterium]